MGQRIPSCKYIKVPVGMLRRGPCPSGVEETVAVAHLCIHP